MLRILDENLKHLGSVNIKSHNIFLRNQKIFSQTDGLINIINEDSGFLESDFEIKESFALVGITRSDEIITSNSDKGLIRIYKIDGTLATEFSMPHFDDESSFHINRNGKCVINNRRKVKLYFN